MKNLKLPDCKILISVTIIFINTTLSSQSYFTFPTKSGSDTSTTRKKIRIRPNILMTQIAEQILNTLNIDRFFLRILDHYAMDPSFDKKKRIRIRKSVALIS